MVIVEGWGFGLFPGGFDSGPSFEDQSGVLSSHTMMYVPVWVDTWVHLFRSVGLGFLVVRSHNDSYVCIVGVQYLCKR